jgi:hypothetical protein
VIRKIFLIFPFFFLVFCVFPQKLKFPEQSDFLWPDNTVKYPELPGDFNNQDMVALNDVIELKDGMLYRRVTIKLINEKGVKKMSTLRLPEDLDLINFSNGYRQGRFKDQSTPFCYTYEIKYFAARTIRNRRINELSPTCSKGKVFWVRSDGSRIKQDIFDFSLGDVEVNDIVEIMYKAEVGRARLFISLNTRFPRVKLQVLTNGFLGFNNLRPQDTLQMRKPVKVEGSYFFEFKDLNGIAYPDNSGGLRKLPYIVFNQYAFPWTVMTDSISKKKYNTKEQNSLRKYAETFKREPSDSSGNKILTQLIDSINSLTYVSAESMHYSANSQYAITSSEHLLRRRLVEEFMIKTYDQLLEEMKIFFYFGIIGDKRKSEVKMEYYTNTIDMEGIFAVTQGKSIIFYKTRKDGLKYFPNELPYYLEGTNCALMPQNLQFAPDKNKGSKMIFTKTPKSSFNDNVRSESAQFLVKTDSLFIKAQIKESLGGQYSTLLRSLYKNEYIDSTVQPVYYKKCIDKPGFRNANIKRGLENKFFPFKCSFNCAATSVLPASVINLKDWFSFNFSIEDFQVAPDHDFYVDFQLTDSYNYLFEFDKAVEILNTVDLTKRLSNEYFEISSNLVKQENTKYLLSVIVKIKQDIIPEKNGYKLSEFVKLLDEINNFKLNYKIL